MEAVSPMNLFELGDVPSNKRYSDGHITYPVALQVIVLVPSYSSMNFRNILISQEINTSPTELATWHF